METTLSYNLLTKFPVETFVETGTYIGAGILEAFKAGFVDIYSIELHIPLYNQVKFMYSGFKSVKIFNGESPAVLMEILPNINGNITFWLDAHYSGTHTAIANKISPVMEELDAIKTHPIKTHTILVDDIRYFHNGEYGITVEELEAKIREINPDYTIYYENGYIEKDILVAYISNGKENRLD